MLKEHPSIVLFLNHFPQYKDFFICWIPFVCSINLLLILIFALIPQTQYLPRSDLHKRNRLHQMLFFEVHRLFGVSHQVQTALIPIYATKLYFCCMTSASRVASMYLTNLFILSDLITIPLSSTFNQLLLNKYRDTNNITLYEICHSHLIVLFEG